MTSGLFNEQLHLFVHIQGALMLEVITYMECIEHHITLGHYIPLKMKHWQRLSLAGCYISKLAVNHHGHACFEYMDQIY